MDTAEGFNMNSIGVILMVVGAIALLVTLAIFGRRRSGGVEGRRIL